jgi:hypothetical protein
MFDMGRFGIPRRAILFISSMAFTSTANLMDSMQDTGALYIFGATNFTASATTINGTNISSAAYWDTKVPQFHLFSNDTTGRPDLSREDVDVFDLTEENIQQSAVQLWYLSWTRLKQMDPLWKSKGENYLLAREFLKATDFSCFISQATCHHLPSRHYILSVCPDEEHRALAQRVYLLFEMIRIDHAEAQQGLVSARKCCVTLF